MLKIRKATPKDAEALMDLYINHLARTPQTEPQSVDLWFKKRKHVGFL